MSGLVSARICPSVCLLGKIPLVFRVTMLMFLPVGISGGHSAGVGGSVCMVVSLCPLSAAVGGVGVSSGLFRWFSCICSLSHRLWMVWWASVGGLLVWLSFCCLAGLPLLCWLGLVVGLVFFFFLWGSEALSFSSVVFSGSRFRLVSTSISVVVSSPLSMSTERHP